MKRLIKKSELFGNIEHGVEDLQIFSNPSFNEFSSIMNNGYVNGIIDNNEIYIWDPIISHEDVIAQFGFGNDGVRLRVTYDKITVNDILGYDYVFNLISNTKNELCNMLSKNEYSVTIDLEQNGFTGSLDQFLNNEI